MHLILRTCVAAGASLASVSVALAQQAAPRESWRTPIVVVVVVVLGLAAIALILLQRTVLRRTRELAESERETRAARERLGLAMASSHFVLYTTDRDLRCTWAEGPVLPELGLSREAVVGRTVQELLGSDDPGYPPLAAHYRALRGESVRYDNDWMGRTWDVRVQPLVEHGEIAGLLGISVDVSHRRETERRLEEQTTHFRSLFEEAPEAIVLVDEDRRVLESNPEFERTFGYSSQEAVGRTINELLAPPGADAEMEAISRRVQRGERVETEAVRRRKDGTRIHVSILTKPVQVGGRRLVYGIYRDITEQKNLEAQLLHSQRLEAVGQLAGGVAHDFNNILTAILGHTRLLLDDVGADSELRDDLEEIARSAERGASLTGQLLTFSRRERVARRPVDLNRVIRDMRDMLDRLIEERVRVVFDLADELPAVHADAGQLQQIVMNLVINARDAMPQGGSVVVSTRPTTASGPDREPGAAGPAEWVELTVRDEGIGMSDEERARMFEPFFTTKKAGAGTGLGLSTVYGIVEQSNGTIRVVSAPDAGTTISICLPAHGPLEPSAADAAPERGPEPLSANGGGLILLVDDDRAVREVTRQILRRAGYRVEARESADAALAYCDSTGIVPDLVLTDIVMPGMSGIELARRLRERHPDVKVLLMTGYADAPEGRLEGEDVIRKPFDAMTLVRRLRERTG